MNDQDREALWTILDRNSVREVERLIRLYRAAALQGNPFDFYMMNGKTKEEGLERG